MKVFKKRLGALFVALVFILSLLMSSAISVYACEGESVELNSIGYTGDVVRLKQLLDNALIDGEPGRVYYVGTEFGNAHARGVPCSCGGNTTTTYGNDEYRIIAITCPSDFFGLDLLVEFRDYTATKCVRCGAIMGKSYASSGTWMVACLNGPVIDEGYTWYAINPNLNNPHNKINPNDYA